MSGVNNLIRTAVRAGFTADLQTGDILTPQGQPVNIFSDERGQSSIHFQNRRVRAARFVGYYIFGEIALHRNTSITHEDRNNFNLKLDNLRFSHNGKPLAIPYERIADLQARLVDCGKMLRSALNRQREMDSQTRDDPDLRIAMTVFITELGNLLNTHAQQLACKWGDVSIASPVQIDDAADAILWMTAEFIAQTQFASDEEIKILRGSQISASHAGNWFNVVRDPKYKQLIASRKRAR